MWYANVVILFDIELADRAGSTSGEEPLVDAFCVKVMQTWECTNLFSKLIVGDADHTTQLVCIVMLFEIIFSYVSLRQRVNDGDRSCSVFGIPRLGLQTLILALLLLDKLPVMFSPISIHDVSVDYLTSELLEVVRLVDRAPASLCRMYSFVFF